MKVVLLASVFLFAMFSAVNAARFVAKQNIPAWNFVYWALGATGIVAYFVF